MVKKSGSVCEKNDHKDVVKKKNKQLQVIVLIVIYVIFINHNI